MGRIIYFLQAIGMLFLLTSCIKDDLNACPTEYSAKVYVKDKNYTNIDNVPQLAKKDETLPFGQFVGTVYYQLRNRKTGTLVVESSENVAGSGGQFYTIPFTNIPDGDYELIVWGNLMTGATSGILHSEGKEYTDLYLATKSFTFSAGSPVAELNMERTKGNLVLLCTNFPSDITEVEQQISSLYETVDPMFQYTGNTTVSKITSAAPVIETVLAPSIKQGNSKLNIRFFSGAEVTKANNLAVPEIPLTLGRNTITVVEVDYNSLAGTWEIWTTIDGKWTLIHSLDIKDMIN